MKFIREGNFTELRTPREFIKVFNIEFWNVPALQLCGLGRSAAMKKMRENSFTPIFALRNLFLILLRSWLNQDLIEARHSSLNERISPLRNDRLNIVWHVRTGYICLRCSDTVFFSNVKAFLRNVTLNVPSQNIIVHQRDERVSAIFNASRDTILYADENPENAVKLFLNADILVVTGSSFPAMVAWLTPLHQPLVLLSEKKEHFFGGDENVRGTLYDLSEGRAIRLANDGQVLNYKSRDLTTLLRMKGVIQRVKTNQPLPRAGAYIYDIRYGIVVCAILLLLFTKSRSLRLRLKVKQST